MSDPPTFEHNNEAAKNYIDHLFKSTDPRRTQLILMAGISLNDVKLIKYACDIDPNVVKTPVLQSVIEATDAALAPVTKTFLSMNVEAAKAEESANPTPSQMVWADNNAGPN